MKKASRYFLALFLIALGFLPFVVFDVKFTSTLGISGMLLVLVGAVIAWMTFNDVHFKRRATISDADATPAPTVTLTPEDEPEAEPETGTISALRGRIEALKRDSDVSNESIIEVGELLERAVEADRSLRQRMAEVELLLRAREERAARYASLLDGFAEDGEA